MPYKDKIKQTEAARQYYINNKAKVAKNTKKNRNERDLWFKEIKKNEHCKQCGFSDYRCLDFHHCNKDEKEFSITEGVKQGYSQDRILKEISKCEVLCSNCHLKYHQSNNKKFRKKSFNWLREYKSTQSCNDCGMKDSSVLVFHHIGEKTETISEMVQYACSIEKLKNEISKCEILCSNCHRIKHDGNIWRRNSFKNGAIV